LVNLRTSCLKFSLFGLVTLDGTLADDDRQCAWELYTEITSRVSIIGKDNDPTAEDFSGEVLAESLKSLHEFFREARGIMRKFPVGKIKEPNQKHLGVLINLMLQRIIRPFLETWQSDFRYWYEQNKHKGAPFEVQEQFPKIKEMKQEWSNLRLSMRELEEVLIENYKLTNVKKIILED